MAVDPLLGRSHLDDRVHIQFLLFVDLAVDLHLPRPGAEILGEFGWSILVSGELVIVVVVGDVFVRSNGLGSTERTLCDAVNFVARKSDGGGCSQLAHAEASGNGGPGDGGACQELAAVQV